ncbi:MAG: hypothetical protein RL440_1883 [Bacteroidota bacterium]|jgi:hypothetical protein
MKITLFTFFALALSFNFTAQKSINFTFHNGSLKSIPLVIPSVMNPNLSPMSNSGITLDLGQVVYYFPNGKKRKKEVLFVVDDTFKDGDVLEIDQLIKAKQKEE